MDGSKVCGLFGCFRLLCVLTYLARTGPLPLPSLAAADATVALAGAVMIEAAADANGFRRRFCCDRINKGALNARRAILLLLLVVWQ